MILYSSSALFNASRTTLASVTDVLSHENAPSKRREASDKYCAGPSCKSNPIRRIARSFCAVAREDAATTLRRNATFCCEIVLVSANCLFRTWRCCLIVRPPACTIPNKISPLARKTPPTTSQLFGAQLPSRSQAYRHVRKTPPQQ